MTEPDGSGVLHDLRALDWLAVASATRAVAAIGAEHLELPTPCEAWRLRDLLRHMIGRNRAFAEAARGGGQNPDVWSETDLADDPRLLWDESAQDVVTAFSELRDLSQPVAAPGYGAMVAAQAVRVHFVDLLVHGWDVTASLGEPGALDEESCLEVLRIVRDWPRPDLADEGTAPLFAAPVPVDATASPCERMLAQLGRSPRWPRR